MLKLDLVTASAAQATPAVRASRQRTPLALAALTACLAVAPVHAGRPLATDDAAVVAAGACQFETWFEHWRDARAFWLNPGCNPFGSTEFSFGGAHVRPDGGGAFSLMRGQVKQHVRAYDENGPGLAVAAGAARARAAGQQDVFANGIVTLPLAGEAVLVHLNAGATRSRMPAGSKTRATWAAALDAEAVAGTRAAGEVFGTSGERARWQLGLKHELLPGHLQLDASIGSAFGRWSTTRTVTIGVVAVTPSFLR